MGILQFRTIGAVDDDGNGYVDGFRLSQVHLSVQKSTTGKFPRFSKTYPLYATNGLQQVPHDKRVPMGVQFQNVFAGVGTWTLEK